MAEHILSCIAQYFKLKPFIVDARTSLIVQQITRVIPLRPYESAANAQTDLAVSICMFGLVGMNRSAREGKKCKALQMSGPTNWILRYIKTTFTFTRKGRIHLFFFIHVLSR